MIYECGLFVSNTAVDWLIPHGHSDSTLMHRLDSNSSSMRYHADVTCFPFLPRSCNVKPLHAMSDIRKYDEEVAANGLAAVVLIQQKPLQISKLLDYFRSSRIKVVE
jgi:hypothetical protein